jgi:hypothetical protein
VLLFFSKLKGSEMKKLIMALVVGSAMSTAAFAVEPAATPMALSDSQMDMVTAGGANSGGGNNCQQRPASNRTTVNNSGDTNNAAINVNPVLNVNLISLGNNSQTANSGNNTQTGNVAIVRR